MLEFFQTMRLPALAALTMAPVHAVFGLHIVRRGVIFIDLAVAQVAALGMAFALARGVEPDSATAYWIAVGAALAGAFLISLTRFRLGRVPHEAMIGIVFVVASAGSIIVLQYADHGQELLKTMLDGQILLVSDPAVVRHTALVYGLILLAVGLLWRPIRRISEGDPEAPQGAALVFYDFAFYALLGFVVASSVKVAGVLVVFTWLVMPAVVATFWLDRITPSLFIAIPIGWIGSLLGMYLSLKADPDLGGWPTGASIVITFGAIVFGSYLLRLLIPERPRVKFSVPVGGDPETSA
ncbi:MAG: ABC transporter [Fimbriimonadales bacterium]|nr:MAG: ABC transporter [Fimbriimonadales bacterium]